MKPWQSVFFVAVVAAAFLLRVHDLSRIFLWLDETDLFNESIFGNHHRSLLDFAFSTRNGTTQSWGWSAIFWIVTRMFGPTPAVARMPTALVNTAGVALLFALVYRLLAGSLVNRFWPALFASIFAAVSVVQMNYSQQTYPYGATPFLALAVMLAHFEIRAAAGVEWKATPRLFRAVALYTVAISLSFCIHASAALIPALSMAIIGFDAVKGLRSQTGQERNRLLRWAAASAAIIVSAAALGAKNPKYGYRPYLADYYEAPSLHAIPNLLLHAYGLGSYALNLFYNPALYFPNRLNAVILPLVLICILGWGLALWGQFGREIRHLAFFSAAAVALPAVLSFLRVFPFGGVRQLLFLGPFLMAFAALGFYSLRANRFAKYIGLAAAGAYLVLWAVNLPRFYQERFPQYAPQEVVKVWRENGELPIYARFSEREYWYELRDHPEIHIEGLSYSAKPPYLLMTTHNWVGDDRWLAGYPEYLRQAGYRVTLLTRADGFYIDRLLPSGCLYFPPNGFWIYKITAE